IRPLLTSAPRPECLAAFSVAEATRDRSPGVSSAAFRAQSPNLRFASLMDMDFAVRCPLVRCLRLVFGFCPSTHAFARCFLQTPPRGSSPCTLLALHLHQVGQRTFTSKLLSMPSTQRRRQAAIPLRDARYFAARVRTAQVVPNPTSTDAVAFGSTVTFRRDDGRVQKYRIVGEDEADPKAGSISFVAPVARLLMGKAVGDVVGASGQEIEIISIA